MTFTFHQLDRRAFLFLHFIFAFLAFETEAEDIRRPNILFAISDDQSYPHASAYGCDWIETPAFDRIAREGLLFTRAYTPNAKCAPSRSILLTGRYSWELGAGANHWPIFPPEFATYAEVLADAGYHTGYTGKGWGPGTANDAAGKPREMAGAAYRDIREKPPTSEVSSINYAANFEKFFGEAESGEPWCFWYGGYEPHRRYEAGSGARITGRAPEDIDEILPFWPDNEVTRNDLLDYAAEIEHFDLHLTRMLAFLEAKGELDNTLVVVTSDNGMPFPRAKSDCYEISNHLPLAIRWPGGITDPGRTVDDYVCFTDIAPTFIEAAGLEWEGTALLPTRGRSLTDIFRNDPDRPARDRVLVGKERHDVGRPDDAGYPVRGIVRDGFLYLRNFKPDRWPLGNPQTGYPASDGNPIKRDILAMRREGVDMRYWEMTYGKRPAEELYDLERDPHCVNNLADHPSVADRQERLRDELMTTLEEHGDPRVLGEGDQFDAYPYSDGRTRNLYNRLRSGEEVATPWLRDSDRESLEEFPFQPSLPTSESTSE